MARWRISCWGYFKEAKDKNSLMKNLVLGVLQRIKANRKALGKTKAALVVTEHVVKKMKRVSAFVAWAVTYVVSLVHMGRHLSISYTHQKMGNFFVFPIFCSPFMATNCYCHYGESLPIDIVCSLTI